MVRERETSGKPYTVDTRGLQKMLSCGYHSAVKTGQEAGAAVKIGRRRLWIVSKIENYLTEKAAAESEG